jgi:tetratricopeptide (TPR) repeat protein
MALPRVFWPNQVPPGATARATVTSPNLWEQVRSELHGNASPSPVPVRTEVPRMDEVLLRALFDNGGNFSQLREREKLAVIVTFGPTLLARGSSPPAAQLSPAGTIAQNRILAYVAADEKNNELLGDLHLKQGRPDEAVKAYRNAVERGSASVNLLAKLAQAYLAAHDLEAARKALEEATRAAKEHVHQLHGRRQNAEPVPLPGTMTISVSQETLAQLRAGKLDFEGFRKQAAVDYASPSGSN